MLELPQQNAATRYMNKRSIPYGANVPLPHLRDAAPLVVLVQAQQRRLDAIVHQQPLGVPRVLRQHRGHLLQDPYGAQRDILQVPCIA